MQTQIYSIFDSKAEAHLPPFFFRNDGECLRAFQSTVNDKENKNNQIAAYPSDYTLIHLGTFNTLTGELTPQPRRIVANATEYLQ